MGINKLNTIYGELAINCENNVQNEWKTTSLFLISYFLFLIPYFKCLT
jgi:hypothetical protein